MEISYIIFGLSCCIVIFYVIINAALFNFKVNKWSSESIDDTIIPFTNDLFSLEKYLFIHQLEIKNDVCISKCENCNKTIIDNTYKQKCDIC